MSGSAANDSSTGGYVLDRPLPGPPSGEQITAVVQNMVAQLSGLPGVLVRPRWQPFPPTQPAANVTWAAVGIIKTETDEYPYIAHDGTTQLAGAPGPGADRMQRHATVTIMASFYGPDAEDAAGSVRDALYIQQNMEPLAVIGAKILSVHDIQRAPEIINQQFIDRVDVSIELRQQIDRVYPILDIASAVAQVNTDQGSTLVTVVPGVPPTQTR
jgi:hypothetical protein